MSKKLRVVLEAPSQRENYCYQHDIQFASGPAYRSHVEWCERFLEVPNLCTYVGKDGFMCGLEFKHVATLLFHCLSKHGLYLCVHCKTKFKDQSDLEAHSHVTKQAHESKRKLFIWC